MYVCVIVISYIHVIYLSSMGGMIYWFSFQLKLFRVLNILGFVDMSSWVGDFDRPKPLEYLQFIMNRYPEIV